MNQQTLPQQNNKLLADLLGHVERVMSCHDKICGLFQRSASHMESVPPAKAERLQSLDTQLYQQLAQTKLDCEALNKVLLPVHEARLEALRTMGKQAVAELHEVINESTEATPTTHTLEASMDVMCHFVEQLEDLRSALAGLVLKVERFAASSYYDTHTGMMPHLSREELACINEVNYFIPRASTEGRPPT